MALSDQEASLNQGELEEGGTSVTRPPPRRPVAYPPMKMWEMLSLRKIFVKVVAAASKWLKSLWEGIVAVVGEEEKREGEEERRRRREVI